MKKILKGAFVAVVAASTLVGANVAYAYNQAEYTGNGAPQFNTYTSVLNFGNEKDFLRVGPVDGKGSTSTNEFDVCTSNTAALYVYIHNGAPEGFNGENNTGSGVAKNTKLNIQLPNGETGNKFGVKATVSADNAATVTDGATLNCNGQPVKLEYVKGSATIFGGKRTNAVLSDAVVNNGTLVGTYADDGVVPGCWDSRVYVKLQVKVTKLPTPPTPPTPTPPTPQPPVLPNTGAGDMLGLFAATTIGGAAAHRVFTARRSKRD